MLLIGLRTISVVPANGSQLTPIPLLLEGQRVKGSKCPNAGGALAKHASTDQASNMVDFSSWHKVDARREVGREGLMMSVVEGNERGRAQ